MKNALPNTDFFAQVEAFIAAGEAVHIQVQGNSMRPLLPNGHVVVLYPCTTKEIQPGEVVLFRYHNVHILHRVISRQEDRLILQGDGNINRQETATTADVVAIVREVLSPSGHIYSTRSRSWRIRSHCWKLLSPFRRYLLAIYDRL